jgi:hypothetical protein
MTRTEPLYTAAELAPSADILYGSNGSQPDQQTYDSWQPLNLNTLPEQPPVPPNLGNTGLIYPGKRHVFSGPPEAAKTIAAYCVLIQIVRCGNPAILIDFEMGSYDTRNRLRELGATPDEIDHIGYLEPTQPATPERLQALLVLEPALVVIDAAVGAYNLQGLDDNKRSDAERISQLYIGIFWSQGIATILIDHVVKNAEHRGQYQIGSERKLGATDVHFGFDTLAPISRGNNGKYKITTHKDRGGYLERGHIADLELNSDPTSHQIAWRFLKPTISTDQKGRFRYTIYMERVSKRLELATAPMGVNEIKADIGGDSSRTSHAINSLIDEDYVRLEEGPNRAKLVSSVKPYRQDSDPLLTAVDTPGDSVVREWFASDSRTTCASGGSVVRPPYGDDTTRSTTPATPKTVEWFADDIPLP